ncbi:hypothetical protein B0H13DRAFT_2012096, partial [Mycena leptocephala]
MTVWLRLFLLRRRDLMSTVALCFISSSIKVRAGPLGPMWHYTYNRDWYQRCTDGRLGGTGVLAGCSGEVCC